MKKTGTAKLEGSGVILRHLIAKNALGIAMMNLSFTLSILIDGVIVGRFLGDDAIAVFGLVGPVNQFVYALTCIIGVGFQTACTKTLAKGDREAAAGLFTRGALLALAFGLFTTVGGLLGAGRIASLLGAAGVLHTMSRDYLLGLMSGMVARVLQAVLLNFINMEGDSRCSVLSTLVMSVVNIGGDLVCVFFFDGTMFGIALATSASYFVSLLVLLPHFRSSKTMLRLQIRGLSWRGTLQALYGGLPAAAVDVIKTLRVYGVNLILMTAAGGTAVAAFSIFNSWSGVATVGQSGISSTVMILAGIFSGEKDRESIARSLKTGLLYAFLVNACVTLVTIVGSPLVVMLFLKGRGTDVATMAVGALRLLAIGFLGEAFTYVYQRYLIGLRKVGLANLVCALPVVYQLVLSLLLGRFFGLNGIWLSYLLGQCLAIVTVLLFTRSANGLLLLPRSFGVSPEQSMEYTVHSLDDLSPASAAVGAFCREQGADRRNVMMVSLCVEEMARNTIERGFDDRRPHQIAVRLVRDEDQLILRIRDDCPAFNPELYFKNMEPDDPANIGIRIVFGMAEDVKYVPLLGLNTLIVTTALRRDK